MATGAEATEATGHTLRHIIKSCVPEGARRWLRKLQGVEGIPEPGRVHFGSLRRVLPISRTYGFDRGQPIDRYYIERFLARHADDIRGRVLEIADDAYTRRFGGRRVTTSDVLHVVEGNPHATIVADLTNAGHLPSEQYDCVILTQVLSVIYDVRAALRTVYRLLKPGGTLLATTPGVAHHLSRYDMDRWGEYWHFTSLSARRLFEEVFPAAHVDVRSHGNVLAAVAFLHGLASEEFRPEELDYADADYEVSVTIKATKPEAISEC